MIAFREMAQRLAVTAALVEQLLEESALQAGRLEALEVAQAAPPSAGQTECTVCEARRAGDAARQQRRRDRHVTN